MQRYSCFHRDGSYKRTRHPALGCPLVSTGLRFFLKGLKDQVNIASALGDRGITRIPSFHLQVTDNAYAGLHLGKRGGALAPP